MLREKLMRPEQDSSKDCIVGTLILGEEVTAIGSGAQALRYGIIP